MVCVTIATGADAARYIQIDFVTGLAPYYGFEGPDQQTRVNYLQSWRGSALIDTEIYPANEMNYVPTPSASTGFTFVTYDNSGVDLFELPSPDGHRINAGFTPVDLTSPAFSAELTRGTFTDVFLLESRYNITDTTSARLRSLSLVGFDSPELLTSYVRWSPAEYVPVGVPEPASWGMMVIGLGAVGAGLRHRRKARPRIA
jgi:hypothetical protein